MASVFGAQLQLRVVCTRAEGDITGALIVPVRMATPALAWTQTPPASLVSQQSFGASLVLLDSGAAVAMPPAPSPRLDMDSVTVCSLLVVSNDTGVILQNGVATAVAGAVTFPAAAVTARAGMVVRGRVTCVLGDLALPDQLDWAVSMQPCPLGTAPAGANGYSCGICGGGSYSDGGMGVRACTPCPIKGATCLGGVLQLEQSFYRADRGATVDAATELHECAFPAGCVVNSSTVGNRAWNATHRCADGYSGVLCGVCSADGPGFARSGNACLPCWSPAANSVAMALFPLAFLALCVYIVNKKSKRSSMPDTALRILTTYVQTIGTLTAIYQAKGTAGYATAISFSQLLGGSPLSVGPVECGLRPSYTARFAITIVLPFIIAVTCVLIILVRRLAGAALRRFGGAAGANGHGAAPRAPASGSATLLSSTPDARLDAGATASLSGQTGDARGLVVAAPMLRAAAPLQSRGSSPGQLEEQVEQPEPQPQLPRQPETVRGFVRDTLRELIAPIIFVLNLGYSSIVSSAFTVFACTPEPIAGVRYLVADLTIACNTPAYTAAQVAAGVVIFAFGFGFPALFAYVLWRRRASLSHPETFSRFGFLYDGYKTQRGLFMFESLVMLRKSGVVLLGSVISDAYFQVSGAVVLMSVSLLTLAVLQPFKKRIFNVLEAATVLAVIVTEVVCIFYLRADAVVAPCTGAQPGFVPAGQASTCAQLLDFKRTSDVGVTFLLCLITIGVIAALAGVIAYLRLREAALAKPDSRAAACMRSSCGRRLVRYAKKLELETAEERAAVDRKEARRTAKLAALGESGRGAGTSVVRRGSLRGAALRLADVSESDSKAKAKGRARSAEDAEGAGADSGASAGVGSGGGAGTGSGSVRGRGRGGVGRASFQPVRESATEDETGRRGPSMRARAAGGSKVAGFAIANPMLRAARSAAVVALPAQEQMMVALDPVPAQGSAGVPEAAPEAAPEEAPEVASASAPVAAPETAPEVASAAVQEAASEAGPAGDELAPVEPAAPAMQTALAAGAGAEKAKLAVALSAAQAVSAAKAAAAMHVASVATAAPLAKAAAEVPPAPPLRKVAAPPAAAAAQVAAATSAAARKAAEAPDAAVAVAKPAAASSRSFAAAAAVFSKTAAAPPAPPTVAPRPAGSAAQHAPASLLVRREVRRPAASVSPRRE